jgi:hypothetical protein
MLVPSIKETIEKVLLFESYSETRNKNVKMLSAIIPSFVRDTSALIMSRNEGNTTEAFPYLF